MGDAKPNGWGLFVFYILTLALAYLLVVAMGVVFLAFPELSQNDFERWMMGAICFGTGLPLLIATCAVLFLPRKKWSYYVHIAMIGLGMTSCLWWPLAIPLLITWTKPETKAWYTSSSP